MNFKIKTLMSSALNPPDEIAHTAAIRFCQNLASSLNAKPALQPLSMHIIGSLAHGGFSRRYSDIDVALVTEQGLSQAEIDAIHAEAAKLSSDLASKISLFWSDRHFSVGRFPPLDRVDYLDHAIPLLEHERIQPPRPNLEDIRNYLSGRPFANWEDSARRFAALDALDVKDHKPYLRTLLYPARFVYSWITGRITSNDDAVARLNEERPATLNIDLLTDALECRRAARDPDSLFPGRCFLPQQIEACKKLICEMS